MANDETRENMKHLRLAASNDQADIDCQYALQGIERALLELAANSRACFMAPESLTRSDANAWRS